MQGQAQWNDLIHLAHKKSPPGKRATARETRA